MCSPHTVGLTRLRDVVPVWRVKLIVPGQDFAEEVLVVVLIVFLLCLFIEGGVPRKAGGQCWGTQPRSWPTAPHSHPIPHPALTGCT